MTTTTTNAITKKTMIINMNQGHGLTQKIRATMSAVFDFGGGETRETSDNEVNCFWHLLYALLSRRSALSSRGLHYCFCVAPRSLLLPRCSALCSGRLHYRFRIVLVGLTQKIRATMSAVIQCLLLFYSPFVNNIDKSFFFLWKPPLHIQSALAFKMYWLINPIEWTSFCQSSVSTN